jgi:IS30 family transposase
MARYPSKRKTLDPMQLGVLGALSEIRLPMDQIAQILGIHKSTLLRMVKRDNAVRDTLEQGRAIASYRLRQTLCDLALSGDIRALIFWCRTQEGFVNR